MSTGNMKSPKKKDKRAVSMATRTHTSTPVREVGLTAAVAAANAPIEAQNKVLEAQDPPGTPIPLWTNDTYLLTRIDEVLDSYARQHQADTAQRAVGAFTSAPQDVQGQILTLLDMQAYMSLPHEQIVQVLGTIGLQKFLSLPVDTQNQIFTLAGLTQ